MAVGAARRRLTAAAEPPRLARRALTAQAAYYLVAGFWPLLHMASFEAVAGPKTDDWLVRMVALLVVVIGLALAAAVRARRWESETRVLAIGAAVAFAGIDIWYVGAGRIALIYLADAALELTLAGVLATQLRSRPIPE